MKGAESIWESLASRHARTASRRHLEELAGRLDLNGESAIRTLLRNHRLEPTFKGIYLVRGPSEVLLHKPTPPLEGFAHAAEAKGIGTWYYGLYTALRLNGLSHEHRNYEYAISTDLYRPSGVPMLGRRFVVLRWRPESTMFGLTRRGRYAFSDPEKTVLDFAYWDHHRTAKGHAPMEVWREHIDAVDPKRVESYLNKYPPSVRRLVEGA